MGCNVSKIKSHSKKGAALILPLTVGFMPTEAPRPQFMGTISSSPQPSGNGEQATLPAPGFNPLTASNKQLVANGFPARPNTADALAAWTAAMKAAHTFVAQPMSSDAIIRVTPSNQAHPQSHLHHHMSPIPPGQRVGPWIASSPDRPGTTQTGTIQQRPALASPRWLLFGQYQLPTLMG